MLGTDNAGPPGIRSDSLHAYGVPANLADCGDSPSLAAMEQNVGELFVKYAEATGIIKLEQPEKNSSGGPGSSEAGTATNSTRT